MLLISYLFIKLFIEVLSWQIDFTFTSITWTKTWKWFFIKNENNFWLENVSEKYNISNEFLKNNEFPQKTSSKMNIWMKILKKFSFVISLFCFVKSKLSVLHSTSLQARIWSIHYHFLLLPFAMMTTSHNFHLFWTIDRISWGVENIRIFSISMKMNRWSLLLWSRILVLTFLFQQQLQKMCNLVLLCSIIHVLQHPGAMEVDKSCYCYVAIFRSNQTATTKCKNLFPLYQSCKIT